MWTGVREGSFGILYTVTWCSQWSMLNANQAYVEGLVKIDSNTSKRKPSHKIFRCLSWIQHYGCAHFYCCYLIWATTFWIWKPQNVVQLADIFWLVGASYCGPCLAEHAEHVSLVWTIERVNVDCSCGMYAVAVQPSHRTQFCKSLLKVIPTSS